MAGSVRGLALMVMETEADSPMALIVEPSIITPMHSRSKILTGCKDMRLCSGRSLKYVLRLVAAFFILDCFLVFIVYF